MKSTAQIKSIITLTIRLLLALLFIYAAFSKLMDFENFKMQLGQSPLVSAYPALVAVGVPAGEIIIAFLLLTKKFATPALFAAFTLMVMFTAYIYIVMNFSAFVPCSCGGVLQKMSWAQHLVFNACVTVMAALAILFLPAPDLDLNTEQL